MIRASFGKSVARSTLIGGLALLALPAVAGCEAGLNAPTLEFHPAAAGATTVFNGMSIGNAFILGAPSGSVPAGSSASLFVGLFNNESGNDKLVGVSAPDAASSVTIKGGSVTIPASGSANLTGPEPEIVLKGLTKPLSAGQTVQVEFDFSTAGEVTLSVPVEPQAFNWANYSAPPSPTPSPTKTAAPSTTATPTTTTGATPTTSPSSTASPSTSPSPTATS